MDRESSPTKLLKSRSPGADRATLHLIKKDIERQIKHGEKLKDAKADVKKLKAYTEKLWEQAREQNSTLQSILHSRSYQLPKKLLALTGPPKQSDNTDVKEITRNKPPALKPDDITKISLARGNLHNLAKLKRKFKSGGFVAKAYDDILQTLVSGNLEVKHAAAWELMSWHASRNDESHARAAIEFLELIRMMNIDKKSRELDLAEIELRSRLQHHKKLNQLLKKHDGRSDGDIHIALSNIENETSAKIDRINTVFDGYGLDKIGHNQNGPTLLDSISSASSSVTAHNTSEQVKVSIIMPAYNAEQTISTAIKSVLQQTWTNLELLVVDDCSDDSTAEIIKKHAAEDGRIKLIKCSLNQGPFVAQNMGLKQATGEFVTCHDADDWSHPRKIEIQANHLIENDDYIGNTSQLIRIDQDLQIHRAEFSSNYIKRNYSSFMFRKREVLESVGFWDSVRFGGDSEFLRRVRSYFGSESVKDIESGPLSLARKSGTSLTSSTAFGANGFLYGANKYYKDRQIAWHEDDGDIFIDFPLTERHFYLPRPLRPDCTSARSNRHFDVIICSDFRLEGGSTFSSIEEIKAQNQAGLNTAIVQMNRYDIDPGRTLDKNIRKILDTRQAEMLFYGEKASCDLLIIRHPAILEELQEYVPDINAKNIIIVANQTPLTNYEDTSQRIYNIKNCTKNAAKYFDKNMDEITWHSISQITREVFQEHHANEIEDIPFTPENWVNIIDQEEWGAKKKKIDPANINIGRHSRDSKIKWPEDKKSILQCYPDSSEYQINIMGGAQYPEDIIGYLPQNWKVYEYNELSKQDYLDELDIFIFYPPRNSPEAFARNILEAMAAGVPVVAPLQFRKIFQEAALYAEPEDIETQIQALVKDSKLYSRQTEVAIQYVNKNFSYKRHLERLGQFLDV